ncbi:hypothetical protein GCM10022225_59500 [Plantactinospora mayteni]|uniref:Uncharacterized protein n=1 Tax=Plantactinospora mayteni TaxID=566021 RepID=A0ABQ4EKB5_9ACTN|nr:hypothetical protein [Plantactinospora mayteni]GIG95199.1 hypothetical protein Pma05_17720 [Plantactinospora mayteni]
MTTSELSDSHCYVLRPGTPASAVSDLAVGQGWELVADQPRGYDRVAIRRWRVTGGTETGAGVDEMELIDDHIAGYRAVTAPDLIRDRIAGSLPLWSADDLFTQAQSAADPLVRMRALRALQYFQIVAAMQAAPQAPLDPDDPDLRLIADDERYLAAFRRGLEDPVPGVRRAALDGLCRTFYPGAQAILREYRDRLPDHTETIDWYLEKGTHRIRAKADGEAG